MAIHVVESYPNQEGFRRFVRGVATSAGVLLVVLGMLAAVLDLFLAGVLVVPNGINQVDTQALITIGVLMVVVVLAPWLGIVAIRGRRRKGLFLRRFGYRDATQTMSAVLAGRTGRVWRVVALDDANLAPVGTAKPTRRLAVLLAVLAVAASGAGLYLLFSRGIPLAAPAPGGAIEAVTAAFDSQLVFAIAVSAFLAVVILLLTAALVIGIAGGLVSRAAQAAQQRATVVIGRGDDVRPATSVVHRNSRRVFGTRLVICRAANPLWQDAVRELAAVSDAVVLDVSHATDTVVWEVEHLREAGDLRWVLVCHRDRLPHLRNAATTPGTSPAMVALAELLDGQQILVYGSTAPEQRRFARSLRNRLDAAARTKRV